MIERAFVAAFNHLLAGQDSAREKLRPFAGRCVRLRMVPLPDLVLEFLDTGEVRAAGGADAELAVTISPAAVPRLLARDESAMKWIVLEGPADLAEAVVGVCRGLEWDVEEDLSRLVGDIAAHRIVGTARDLGAWQKDAVLRLAQNAAEYLTEERPVLARSSDAEAFRRDIAALAADCERMEGRIEALEHIRVRA